MVIAIDHGNKQIKTVNKTFVNGFKTLGTKPGFGSGILEYDNQFYVLSSNRKGYTRVKSNDEDCWITTLFGIGYELMARNVQCGGSTTIPITLLVGLPPAHYGMQYKAFTNYFLNRGSVDFVLDGKKYRIRVDECYCYVQDFAAITTVFGQVKNYSRAVAIDIGGYTVDYLFIENGIPDVSACDSLDGGVIKLYNSISSRVNGELDLLVDDKSIDAVLLDKQSDVPASAKTIIREVTDDYIANMVSKLRERDIDLRSIHPVFVGGGSILLEKYLTTNPRISKNAIVVDDLAANARGYELLYRQSHHF